MALLHASVHAPTYQHWNLTKMFRGLDLLSTRINLHLKFDAWFSSLLDVISHTIMKTFFEVIER